MTFGNKTLRDDQTSQVLIEGMHDATIVGMSLIDGSCLSLSCSQQTKVRELYVKGSREVMILGEGLVLPVIMDAMFLDPSKEQIIELMSEQQFERLAAKLKTYLNAACWMLVVTATYGDGFVITGTGSAPEIFWRN